jgi:hypothetical protein
VSEQTRSCSLDADKVVIASDRKCQEFYRPAAFCRRRPRWLVVLKCYWRRRGQDLVRLATWSAETVMPPGCEDVATHYQSPGLAATLC